MRRDLLALPTLPVVLGYPGMWLKDPATGVDWVRLVHGEQGLTLHRPAPEGEVIGRTRSPASSTRAPDKGALIYTERTVTDAASGELIATLGLHHLLPRRRRLRRPERAGQSRAPELPTRAR
jgi:hypothetical protein